MFKGVPLYTYVMSCLITVIKGGVAPPKIKWSLSSVFHSEMVHSSLLPFQFPVNVLYAQLCALQSPIYPTKIFLAEG